MSDTADANLPMPEDPFADDNVDTIPPVQICEDQNCAYGDPQTRQRAFYSVVMQAGGALSSGIAVLRRHGEEIAGVAMLEDLLTFLQTVDTYLTSVDFYKQFERPQEEGGGSVLA